MAESEEEKKNKRIATFTTIGVNVVVLLILFLIAAWRAPNPPLPEYGIELNFGMDTQGSGEVQPREPVGSPEAQEEVQEQQSQPEETAPEPVEEQQQTETAAPSESKPAEQQVTSKVESPVAVKEEKKEESKPVEKPVEQKPVPKPVEKKPEPKVEERRPDPAATYDPNKVKTADASDKAGQPGSQGDDKNKTGDKGKVEGTLKGTTYKGQPGGGGGGVSISGFNGFKKPKILIPELPSESYGVYEFSVKVDDKGYILSVTPVKRGLSLKAEQILRKIVQDLEFIPEGTNIPPSSEGKISFEVVSGTKN